MLVTKDNLSEAAKLIRNSEVCAWLVVFGREDSYAMKSKYCHLFSTSISNKDYKPFLPRTGYDHDRIRRVEEDLESCLHYGDCCLVFCNSANNPYHVDDKDLLVCKEKAGQTKCIIDYDAIEKAEPHKIIF